MEQKTLSVEEFAAEMKGCAADIETAKDCLQGVMQYLAIQDPQTETERSRECLFWVAIAIERLQEVCEEIKKIEL